MNLHGIVAPYIGAVNPFVSVGLEVSTGTSVTQPDGTRIPQYSPLVRVQAQIQPLSTRDLMQMEGINQNGVMWKIYLYGAVNGIVRPENKGGDLITVYGGPHTGKWLITQILEQWPDWVAATMVLQNKETGA